MELKHPLNFSVVVNVTSEPYGDQYKLCNDGGIPAMSEERAQAFAKELAEEHPDEVNHYYVMQMRRHYRGVARKAVVTETWAHEVSELQEPLQEPELQDD